MATVSLLDVLGPLVDVLRGGEYADKADNGAPMLPVQRALIGIEVTQVPLVHLWLCPIKIAPFAVTSFST